MKEITYSEVGEEDSREKSLGNCIASIAIRSRKGYLDS